ncbi:MAG: DNA methyltransferase [Acidobacteriaceae bacterium]
MEAFSGNSILRKATPTSTVGRGRAVKEIAPSTADVTTWSDDLISVQLGNSLNQYRHWGTPTVIVSDGGYGVLGFEGDTSDHLGLPDWYEPHIAAWSKQATPSTTLWFWNSEIGWAAVHPILEKHGWRYINANIWNKGKGHIAGNVNTSKIRRFPVVSEVCVQYVFEARVNGLPLKSWLLQEWKRTGLPARKANEACGVADVATRKYLDQGYLWYYPPPEMFVKMQEYANKHGAAAGRPYFSLDGQQPGTLEQWAAMRSKFDCPHGFTNVWERNALRGSERFKVNGYTGKAIHLNQKPLDLTTMIIRASSNKGDVVWEPFGGLFTACLAARNSERRAFGAEIDATYFHYAVKRLIQESRQYLLPGCRTGQPELAG